MWRNLCFISLLFLLALPIASRSQNGSALVSMGRIVAMESDQHAVAMSTSAVECSFSWRFSDDLFWHAYHRNPDFGIRFSAAHIPHGIAGDRFGAVGFMQVPITSSLDWSVGLGLSAYNRPFSITQNSSNQYIGSILNCLIDLGLIYKIPLPEEGSLMLQARFLHTSNGYLHKPNLGLNYWQLGIGYDFSPQRTPQQLDSLRRRAALLMPSGYDRNMLFASYAPGIVQSRHSLKQGWYYCYTAELGYLRRLHPCHTVGCNVDIMMNGSHPEWIMARRETPPPCYLGACAIYQHQYGPMSIRLSLGTNIIKSSLIEIPIYERVGLFYHFGHSQNHYAGIAMKAYMGHVDYIEWTYGFQLPLHSRTF